MQNIEHKEKKSMITHIVGIFTHINLCIHKFKYSFNCMYTRK